MNSDFITYLIEWLVDDHELAQQIAYSSDPKEWEGKRLVIRPSGFFDDGIFLTQQTLVEGVNSFLPSRGWIDGMEDVKYIPVLFGTNEVHEENGRIILNADLIAATFYLTTRYEELINTNRDNHGRFPAQESWLMRNGMMHYPIVDEYTDYIHSLFKKDIKPHKLKKIYLTHDIDTIEFYRHFRGFAGGLWRGQCRQAFEAMKGLEYDPAYTFPWLIETDGTLPAAEQIYFIKSGKSDKGFDYPMYNLYGSDMQQLLLLLENNNVSYGLHCSYAAGEDSFLIADEKNTLQQVLGKKITSTRYHYLRTCDTDDFQVLADMGITDDYTMGFAQLAGFRLGTCRPIRWINPRTRQVTNLTLHPLTAMDNSLSEYMKLDAEDSYQYVKDLIEQTIYHGGEISLLWHNSNFAAKPWQQELYARLINYLKSLQ